MQFDAPGSWCTPCQAQQVTNLYALIKFAQGHAHTVAECSLCVSVSQSLPQLAANSTQPQPQLQLLLQPQRFIYAFRLQVVRTADSKDWTLHVKYAQPRDSGIYECQVNTEPKISMAFRLNVIGEYSCKLATCWREFSILPSSRPWLAHCQRLVACTTCSSHLATCHARRWGGN